MTAAQDDEKQPTDSARGPTWAGPEKSPSTTFEVHLIAHPFDPSCTSAPVDFGFVTLTTNGVGNSGVARRTFHVSDVPPQLRDATHGIHWEVRSGTTTIYATGCEVVTLD